MASPVTVTRDKELGFPDDTEARGPTVISTATLEAVAEWFPETDADEMRRRFRANLEIGDVPAFWEDQLYTTAGSTRAFSIGDVRFAGTNPCQRCVVPTRDSFDGTAEPGFSQRFEMVRRNTLPPWAEASRFNHYYRLAVNTLALTGQGGMALSIGDDVVLH